MVVGVVVQVEQIVPRGTGEALEHVRPAPFADVDHALQHRPILHYPPEGPGGTVGRMGAQEWLIIAVVVLVLFGGSQLPKLARSLGEAQKEFKKGVTDVNKDETSAKSEQPRQDRAVRQARRRVAPRREPATPERRFR